MFKKNDFLEFHSSEVADEWAVSNFGQWIERIRCGKDDLDKNSIGYLLYIYSGNMNGVYNNLLREVEDFSYDEKTRYYKQIDILVEEINKHELPEDIVVYRYTHKRLFRHLFKDLKVKAGNMFTDKGFMSTTLVPELIREFARSHRYNCILKLYLPKGTKGAYLKFDKSILNEQEILLPPNSKFKLLRKYFSFKYGMVYECELIYQ